MSCPSFFRICDAGQWCFGFLRNDVNVVFFLLVDFQILTMKFGGKRGAETGGFYFWQLFDRKMVAQKHHQQLFTQKIMLGSRDRHPVLKGVRARFRFAVDPLAKFSRQRVTHRSLMRMMFRRPHVSFISQRNSVHDPPFFWKWWIGIWCILVLYIIFSGCQNFGSQGNL